ncbi:pyruvate formate lyase activating enzyme [Streptomyces sp. 2323.1]|uniref:AmmeMemoRadiSam system radical SAM enzyme n=1 Tax=Streptomyces sp. 2323.1 TaxID=1938841 RepID=UPI000BB74409|nr:AmmeMemoRadiSam system radical SAM enzyme [Streptomyces sp. 2323.1]SOE10450.1 pyruvate formate lyase activating enzyme [Streptomyces sp. 2323.1]
MADKKWQEVGYPARLEERLPDDVVRCHLSPRKCRIRPGQHGFCMVRGNRDGRLVSLNYGRSVHATEETIETEAVFHYEPGARILSMGNIGCMLNCDYCHNWKTSQARYVEDKDVFYYSPQEVVDIAKRHGIGVISWTYNDPVVWHEFVVETAALAKEAGIVNLYKSAFFISEKAIEELIPVIDIFSISIKSIDPKYYRKITKGWLEPVLDGTEQVYRAGKHVEVSTLMVTDLSDNEKTAHDIGKFVLDRLGPEVPTHYVRFHPDYKMTDTIRTPVDRLEAARRVGLDMGLRHVYLGNVYDTDSTSTRCHSCQELQITRYGLNAEILAVTDDGRCNNCGADANIRRIPGGSQKPSTVPALPASDTFDTATFDWYGDVRALHVQVRNDSADVRRVYHRRTHLGTKEMPWSVLELQPQESYRFIAAKSELDERGVAVAIPPGCTSSLHQVFDRAHFPTTAADGGSLNADITPLPLFETRG